MWRAVSQQTCSQLHTSNSALSIPMLRLRRSEIEKFQYSIKRHEQYTSGTSSRLTYISSMCHTFASRTELQSLCIYIINVSIPSKLLFSSAKPRDFDGMLGTGLPVSMYTKKTPIDKQRFNVTQLKEFFTFSVKDRYQLDYFICIKDFNAQAITSLKLNLLQIFIYCCQHHERKTTCLDIFRLSDRQWGTEYQYLRSRFLGVSMLQLLHIRL